MYHYDFEIAGLRIRVASALPLRELFELQNYHRPYSPAVSADLHYSIQLLNDDWFVQGVQVAGDEHSALYETDTEMHRYYYWNIYSKERYVLVRSKKGDPNHYEILLQPAYLDRMLPQFRLAAFFCPEQALLAHQALFVHAAVINWNGHGILFTGPSGVGKSTQATLWERLESAQILNGDRGIIRLQDSCPLVYGSPYAGTSGIYIDGYAPVRCIVVLSQSTENSLRPLGPREAFMALYQQCTVQPWDPWYVEQLSSLLQQIVAQVQVYHLACRPDSGAVNLLKSIL